MSDLFAVGTNKSEPFCVTLNATEVTQLINNALTGEDEALTAKLEGGMPEVEKLVINAMCWESDTFLQEMKTLIKRHGRFAIKHNDVMFGVSTNWDQAKTAFENKEF